MAPATRECARWPSDLGRLQAERSTQLGAHRAPQNRRDGAVAVIGSEWGTVSRTHRVSGQPRTARRTDQPERLRGAKVAVPRPFLLRTARIRVRAAARAAKLPDYLTLAACRHSGITELGDAELAEQGVMAM